LSLRRGVASLARLVSPLARAHVRAHALYNARCEEGAAAAAAAASAELAGARWWWWWWAPPTASRASRVGRRPEEGSEAVAGPRRDSSETLDNAYITCMYERNQRKWGEEGRGGSAGWGGYTQVPGDTRATRKCWVCARENGRDGGGVVARDGSGACSPPPLSLTPGQPSPRSHHRHRQTPLPQQPAIGHPPPAEATKVRRRHEVCGKSERRARPSRQSRRAARSAAGNDARAIHGIYVLPRRRVCVFGSGERVADVTLATECFR
jgi:hypothetical protein